MKAIQIRIFSLNRPIDNWFETLLGRIIKPVIEMYGEQIQWYWFSNYVVKFENGSWGDIGDCDFARLPDEYKLPVRQADLPMHRSVRFRLYIDDSVLIDFENNMNGLIQQHQYWSSGIRSFDFVREVGSDRFLGDAYRTKFNRHSKRADIVTEYFYSLSKFRLDALISMDNDEFDRETNTHPENPNHPFDSMHHMFENIIMFRP